MTVRKNTKHSLSRLQRFLQIVPWLLLFLTLVVTFMTLLQALEAKENLFHAWVTELSYDKRLEFKHFTEPVVTTLRIARDWGKESAINLEERQRINNYFIPMLESIPQIHALIIANSHGQEYFLQRTGKGWQSRSCDPLQWPGKVLVTNWRKGSIPVGKGSLVKSDYDPRQRPWFKGVLGADSTREIFWTSPYRFSSNGQIGITAALKLKIRGFDSQAGKVVPGEDYVIAFDVLLSDLLAWTSELDLGPEGRAFMLSDDGRVLGLSQNGPVRPGENLSAVENPADNGLGPALVKWQRSRVSGEQVFAFFMNDKPWWAGFVPLAIGGRHLWLAVILPEKDILQIVGYPVTFFQIPIIILVVGGLLFFISLFLVRHHLHSLEELHRENRRLVNDESQRASLDNPAQRIYKLIKAGESECLEFKATVRWNLREDRAGNEIETAWLKAIVGFLNTEGGVLLIGVEDDGMVAGLERDNFANDDKCLRHIDSLISSHIGLEFSRFIHFAIVEIGDRKIVEIRCRPSDIPAFLKKREAEEFFIRTGPASRKLKPSQIIKSRASRKAGPPENRPAETAQE
ncbi:MAG: hypothetical protein GXP56_10750 [Deltaproteobacteria bacterium]|nr:hypothetical protein [Deltaproteobacteria bacterium]